MPMIRHPEEGMAWACPECDATKIYRRVDPDSETERHSCATADCDATFAEPVERAHHDPADHPDVGASAKFGDLSWDDLEQASSDAAWDDVGAARAGR